MYAGLDCFVKHLDNRGRLELLREKFGDDPVVGTDFKSMESHHRGLMAQLGLFWMGHVLGRRGNFNDYRYLVAHLLCGVNQCRTNCLSVSVSETLMSGAPWTSSQNAVLNLCLMVYLDLRTKHPQESVNKLLDRYVKGECKVVVEGDDALVSSTGFDKKLIEELGINLTMTKYDHFTKASFCGLLYSDPYDEQVLTNPEKGLTDFFVISSKFAEMSDKSIMGVQRAKAISGAYMHRRTPILSVLFSSVLFFY
jgi:hypothetical protein